MSPSPIFREFRSGDSNEMKPEDYCKQAETLDDERVAKLPTEDSSGKACAYCGSPVPPHIAA